MDYLPDATWSGRPKSQLDQAADDAFDAIEDRLGEHYEPDNPHMRYEAEGYVIETCLDSDLIIIKSAYYTFAQYCSPCVPGAGNLDHPTPEGCKCYCLGSDWFDNAKAPYPVFSVETGKEI